MRTGARVAHMKTPLRASPCASITVSYPARFSDPRNARVSARSPLSICDPSALRLNGTIASTAGWCRTASSNPCWTIHSMRALG
jgi:hypothetical protein